MLLVALLIAGAAVALFRVPRSSWDVLWAEDGTVFLHGALSGNPAVFFEPYAGYLHIVPRLEAALATVFPLSHVPAVIVGLAALTVGALGVCVFVFAERRVTTLPLRMAMWVSFVAMPVAGGEVADSIANLHWYFIVAAFWAVVVRLPTRTGFVVQSLVIALAILSDPLTLLIVPIIAVRAFVWRDRREALLVAIVAAAAAVQLSGVIRAAVDGDGRHFASGLPPAVPTARLFIGRVVVGSVLGARGTAWAGGAAPLLTLVAGTLLVVAVLALALRTGRQRALLILMVAGSVVFGFLMLTLQWRGLGVLGAFALMDGSRYFLVPTALLTGALLLSLDVVAIGLNRRTCLALGAVGIAWVLVIGAVDYRVSNVRVGAPDWPQELVEATRQCQTDPTEFKALTIAPNFFHGTELACALLEREVGHGDR